MPKREQNLKETQLNTNKTVISDKEQRSLVIVIRILYVLIIILMGFIIEALIDRHPVFEFLQYIFLKQESVFMGSIAFAVIFSGYSFLLISIGDFISSSYDFKLNIYCTSLVGIILIIASFI